MNIIRFITIDKLPLFVDVVDADVDVDVEKDVALNSF